jgi:hypothetical protein
MTFKCSTKGRWIFEENVTLCPIHYHQTSMCCQLIHLCNMFLAKDDMLCYYSAPLTTNGYFWIMFEGYFSFTFEHPSALGEVLWLCWFFIDSFTLIPKGHFCSCSKWNELTQRNITFFFFLNDTKKNKIVPQLYSICNRLI